MTADVLSLCIDRYILQISIHFGGLILHLPPHVSNHYLWQCCSVSVTFQSTTGLCNLAVFFNKFQITDKPESHLLNFNKLRNNRSCSKNWCFLLWLQQRLEPKTHDLRLRVNTKSIFIVTRRIVVWGCCGQMFVNQWYLCGVLWPVQAGCHRRTGGGHWVEGSPLWVYCMLNLLYPFYT